MHTDTALVPLAALNSLPNEIVRLFDVSYPTLTNNYAQIVQEAKYIHQNVR
jgi:hypothetical protein